MPKPNLVHGNQFLLTPTRAHQLRDAYIGAGDSLGIPAKGQVFMWDNHEWLVDYAYYLLEYLSDQYGDSTLRVERPRNE